MQEWETICTARECYCSYYVLCVSNVEKGCCRNEPSGEEELRVRIEVVPRVGKMEKI